MVNHPNRNRREFERKRWMFHNLELIGISTQDTESLRRISMTLHRWHEMECGTDNGCIARDETTGKTYWLYAVSGRRNPTPDRETGALRRLAKIMAQYPTLQAYVQGACVPATCQMARTLIATTAAG
jgi:hypothetical protein